MICPVFQIGDKVILTFDDGSIQAGIVSYVGTGEEQPGAYSIRYQDEKEQDIGVSDMYYWDEGLEDFHTENWGYMDVQIVKAKVPNGMGTR